MQTGRRPRGDDDGETLIELIIAVAIMGITVVAIVGGFATSILMSAVHRNETAAGAYLRNSAEALQGSYVSCSSPSAAHNYASSLPPEPIGFNPPTTTVKFWDGSSNFKYWNKTQSIFDNNQSVDCPTTDPGLQQVTLTLKTADNRVTESLVVVLSQ